MSRATERRPLLAGARRAGRAIARLCMAVVAVRLSAAVAGTLVAAAVAAAVFTVGAVRWWARVVEGRLLAPQPTRPTAPGAQLARPPIPLDAERHVAFAQALAHVAARYLSECERDRESRP